MAALITVIVGFSTIERGGITLAIAGFAGGLVGVLTNLAIAEFIKVIIDIEDNTRNTHHCILNQQRGD